MRQADAYGCLLNALQIDQVSVIAYSTGGPAAVQLALRHPGRISGMVLVSTAIADKSASLPPRPVIKTIFGSNFLTWLITHPLQPVMRGMFVSDSYELSDGDKAEISESMQYMLPIEERTQGIMFDMFVTNTSPSRHSEKYALGKITEFLAGR